MPEQFASSISQGGINLSGGQKQRLSIARAIVRRPDVYVFDDSFSALDFTTDARLRAALRAETAHATVFIVAQRISTVITADRIVVLDEGRVVGIGTHAELLKSSEVYREIVVVAGLARRGRMSTPISPPVPAPAPPAAPRTPPPMFGGRPMGGLGVPDAKGQELQGHAGPPARLPAAAPAGAHGRGRCRRDRHGVRRPRPEDPGPRHDEDLRGLRGEGLGRPGRRDRLCRRWPPPDGPRGPVCRRQRVSVPDAVPDGQRGAEDRLHAAPGGRGQVRSACRSSSSTREPAAR